MNEHTVNAIAIICIALVLSLVVACQIIDNRGQAEIQLRAIQAGFCKSAYGEPWKPCTRVSVEAPKK